MNLLKKSGLAVMMGLLAFSVFASNVTKAETNLFAAENIVTFAAESSSKTKCGEGKCGEGKCGESKAKDRCGEGKSK